MRVELCAAFLLLAIACRSPERIEVDAPAGVRAIAVLSFDASGALTRATSLMPWQEDQAVPIEAPLDNDAVIAGWTDEQLAAYPARNGELHTPARCDPQLPEPAWYARWTKDAITTADPSTAPALTADFAFDACPELAGAALDVEVQCTAPRCPSTPLALEHCTQMIDLSACDLGTVRAVFDTDGTTCIETSSSCAYEVFITENAADAPYVAVTKPLFATEERYLPDPTRRLGDVAQSARFEGRAYDLAILTAPEERVVIAAGADGIGRQACPEGDPHAKEQLIFFDPHATDPLAPIATASAPPCLQRLFSEGNTLLAGFARARDWWSLGRFDANGHLLAEVVTDIGFDYQRIDEIAMLGSDRIVVLANVLSGSSYIALFDRATLAHLDTFEISELTSSEMAVVDDHTVALIGSKLITVAWVDVDMRAVVDQKDVPPNFERHANLYGGAIDPLDGSVLVASRGEAEMHRFHRAGSDVERTREHGGESAQLVIADWPLDQSLRLIGGTNIPAFEATMTLFDVRARSFLPGRWTIGHGIVGRVRSDEEGRIWALLPWQGAVVVLTPAR